MRSIELLAPAGNFDCLKAAINNGANAVYLGGKNFSARAFANNFDNEELIKAIEYAHLRNVKIYVTLNTLLNEFEIDNAIKMADFYYENNVDALLIQDLGLYYILKEKYPDFELHCSTQMHVHNIEGIKAARKLGFKRVVLARESDLKLIENACKEDIEIEVFVHGAICTAYSGQCLMSSFTKNRSANKGMCAQCCRLKFELYDQNDNRIKTDTDYLISPKDMYLLDDISKLIDAGVSSFKIEGRMKSPAYVGYVTRLYSKAIDYYLQYHKQYIPAEEEVDNLKVLFNRNFTNDLLYDRNNIYGQLTPNHLGIKIGEVINNKHQFTYIKLDRQLNQFDGIRIADYGCIVNMMYKDDLLVSSGEKGDIIAIKTDQKLSGNVYKTLDYKLEEDINNTADLKIPLDMNIHIHPDENIRVELSLNDLKYEYISDIKAQKAIKTPISTDNIISQFSKLHDTEYYLDKINIDYEDSFVNIKDLNLIRRNAIQSFNEYRLDSFNRKAILKTFEYNELSDDTVISSLIENDGYIYDDQNSYYLNYVINSDSYYSDEDNAVISEIGGLFKEYKYKIAYYTLNCCNSYTYEFLKKMGFRYIILSVELDDLMIEKLIENYQNRTGKAINPAVFVKGKIVLMYLKNNPFIKYTNDKYSYYLSDGNNRYDIINHNNITELLSENYERKPEIKHQYISFEINK